MNKEQFTKAYAAYLYEEHSVLICPPGTLQSEWDAYQTNPEEFQFLLEYVPPTGECAR